MNHYEALKVDKTASQDEIKKSFRKLAQLHHPDHGGDENDFKTIQKAYEILGDPVKRLEYDKTGGVNNINDAIDTAISNVILAILDKVKDVERFDLMKEVTKQFENNKYSILDQIRGAKTALKKFSKASRRLKTKNSILLGNMRARRIELIQFIRNMNGQRKACEAILERLKDYDYKFESAPQYNSFFRTPTSSGTTIFQL